MRPFPSQSSTFVYATRGPIVNDMKIQISNELNILIRLFQINEKISSNASSYQDIIEIHYEISDIAMNTELLSRHETDSIWSDSVGTFFTDVNGIFLPAANKAPSLMAERHYEKKDTLSASIYPVSSVAMIKSSRKSFITLTKQPLGVLSSPFSTFPSSLDLLLGRKSDYDDNKGNNILF